MVDAEALARDQRRIAENRWLRPAYGLLANAAVPAVAYALSFANVLAVLVIPMRAVAGWPRFAKALVVASVGAVCVTWLSAAIQGLPTPNEVMFSMISFVLLVVSAVKITDGVASVGALLGWTTAGMTAFYVFVGVENTRDTFEHLWKYGIAVPVAIVVVVVVTHYTRAQFLPATALLIVGALSVTLGFRSHGLVCFAAVLLLIAKSGSTRRSMAVFKVVFAIGAFYVISVGLPALINSGVFGDTVRERNEEQTASGASPLLAGRVEPPLSIAAILARFWFGWGNIIAVDGPTIDVGKRIAAALGMTDPDDYMDLWISKNGTVSLHSVFFSMWAEGGVLAVIAPLLMVGLFIAAILLARGKWAPLVVLVCVQGVWDLFFSGWGLYRPVILALTAVIACWAITERLRGRAEEPDPLESSADDARAPDLLTSVTSPGAEGELPASAQQRLRRDLRPRR